MLCIAPNSILVDAVAQLIVHEPHVEVALDKTLTHTSYMITELS